MVIGPLFPTWYLLIVCNRKAFPKYSLRENVGESNHFQLMMKLMCRISSFALAVFLLLYSGITFESFWPRKHRKKAEKD